VNDGKVLFHCDMFCSMVEFEEQLNLTLYRRDNLDL